MYRPILPISQVNGFPIAPGFYGAFEVADLQAQIRAIATPEQQAYNASHRTCPVCHGQGYKVERHGKTIVRHKGGCYECHGTGALPCEVPSND